MTASLAAPARVSPWVRLRGQLRNLAPLVTLVALIALFSATSPSFATLSNLSNVLQQVSITAIIAVGLTFVILCAEIDLSVASVANATGILVAFLTVQDASVNIPNLPLLQMPVMQPHVRLQQSRPQPFVIVTSVPYTRSQNAF